jgi:hypothetical protein
LKNLIVISADHHGDCLLGLSFDEKSNVLAIKYLQENIDSRDEIIARVQPLIEEMFPTYTSRDDRIDFVMINNDALASYIGKHLTVRHLLRRPSKGALPSDPGQSIYKLKCAIKELSISGAEWIDRIEVALNAESNPDRIEGHLVQALAYGVVEFIDSDYRTHLGSIFRI